MAAQTYSMDFDGYWRDENKGSLPAKSGVYCVYSCVHNRSEKTVSINKLIYIGEAANVNARVAGHERYNDWKRHLKSGEELCFNFGGVGASDRDRCEAALIFKHKPPENSEYVSSFPFDQTTMKLTGKTRLLTENFTVYRT
ncbi:GIY-YIG nuclease family protein [Halomonas sp. Mc5H-6]|uniref:GIY-YIG nuclease family protein n=1 Tax=Halomonas sp. Mc5H-6 TaxID=2954500 RepID=UPI002096A4F5|nr:GIY-YIG nuclease family protein [Halomonas sp. Mc5H-6]MCO7247533.1 GIY-YIG nuclease family protein [Halomonas sp. Mc5H-6]